MSIKLPKTVKIGPCVYTVKLEKKLKNNKTKEEALGETHNASSVMKLAFKTDEGNVSDQQIILTFLHEILHAVDYVTGDGLFERRVESKIDLLATMLFGLLKDNPKVRDLFK